MGTLAIRAGVAVIVLAVAWLFGARGLSLALDGVTTIRLVSLPSSPVGWGGGVLQFGAGEEGKLGPGGWNTEAELLTGAHVLGLTGPGYKPAARLDADAQGRLVLGKDGQSFVLGVRAGSLQGDDSAVPAFAAEPGDTTSMTLERSLLSWPTPFEMNFMTGNSPSWRRHLYYRLTWRKASGARLDMVWRFEQGYDAANGWRAAGEREGTTGLIRVVISGP